MNGTYSIYAAFLLLFDSHSKLRDIYLKLTNAEVAAVKLTFNVFYP